MQRRTITAVLTAVFLLLCSAVKAQISAVSLQATTAVTSANGPTDWTGPTRVFVSDNSFATSAITGVNKSTYNLDVKGWGFQSTDIFAPNYVPLTATINGIEVTVRLRRSGPGNIRDNKIILLKGGTEAGTNKARTIAWPAVASSVVFGGSSDLWGAAWTAADLINSNFGVRIVARNKGSHDAQAEIDHVSIKVYFNQLYFYSKPTGDLSSTETWGSNTDGSGISPLNFTEAGQIFFLRNRTTTSLTNALTISGTASKMVVGDGSNGLTFTIPAAAALTATVDLQPQAHLVVTNTAVPQLNTISDNTTVTFDAPASQNVPGLAYYNLTLGGSGTKTLQAAGATAYVNNTLTVGSGVVFNNGGYPVQVLGISNAITNNGAITGSGTLSYCLLDVSSAISGTGSYSNLEIDAGTTGTTRAITVNNAITVTDSLKLTDGVLSAGSNLTMASGSIIVLGNGTLSGSLSTSSGFSVFYKAFSNGSTKTTGSELTGGVKNLTVQTEGTITLAQNAVLSGDLQLVSGTLDPSASNYSITLGGNFFNGGTLVNRNSTLTFNGAAPQTLSAASTQTFFNLTLNNSGGGLTLQAPVKLTQSLSLVHGVLFTSAVNSLTLLPGASSTGGGSSSFVSGPLQQVVSSTATISRTFPLGKGDVYRPLVLTLSQSSATATTYTAEVFNQAPPTRTLPSSLSGVSHIRYWTITSSGASSVTAASVQLYFGPDDGVYDAANTRIAKSSGSSWIDLGGSASSVSSGHITSTVSFTSFSDFVLGNSTSAQGVLPVKWLALSGKLVNGKSELEWQTAEEGGTAYYLIQKREEAGTWKDIGKQICRGGSGSRYRFTDAYPVGINYYRIGQVSAAGKVTYSTTIIVKDVSVFSAGVYPNPANHVINLSIKSPQSLPGQQLLVSLINTGGVAVYSRTLAVAPLVQINCSGLSKGSYLLVVQNGKEKATLPLVIR